MADVLGEEPPAHGSPLLGMKNAILTPTSRRRRCKRASAC